MDLLYERRSFNGTIIISPLKELTQNQSDADSGIAERFFASITVAPYLYVTKS